MERLFGNVPKLEHVVQNLHKRRRIGSCFNLSNLVTSQLAAAETR